MAGNLIAQGAQYIYYHDLGGLVEGEARVLKEARGSIFAASGLLFAGMSLTRIFPFLCSDLLLVTLITKPSRKPGNKEVCRVYFIKSHPWYHGEG